MQNMKMAPLLCFGFLLLLDAAGCALLTTRCRPISMQMQPDLKTEERRATTEIRGVVKPTATSGDPAATAALSYADFAKKYPFANNVAIATVKTAAADLLAQTVIGGAPITEVDWQRSLLFCCFGALYLGGFQYLYQVNIFKKLFDVDSFTSQPWADKVSDGPGLRALGAQVALDLVVLTAIYLPTFYIFKAGVFSGSLDPSVWVNSGLSSYTANFAKDGKRPEHSAAKTPVTGDCRALRLLDSCCVPTEFDLVRVWLPADLVCFSVPLYLRLPVRHVVSFVWTAYLSFARGGH